MNKNKLLWILTVIGFVVILGVLTVQAYLTAVATLAFVSKHGNTCNGNTPCFTSVQAAIDASDIGTFILITNEDYDEAANLSSPKNLTLSGGWNIDFSDQSSHTTINSLTITDGSIVTEFIVLDGPPPPPENDPNGLKIFVTSAKHVGDFANDPTLSGPTAMEKADDFCMQDTNLPADGSIYKALLVDGLNRDAVTLTDWVLQPNTIYYRPSGVEIDTTGDDAIFLAFWRDMKNSIGKDNDDAFQNAWTGIANAADFSTNATFNCSGWSSSGMDSGGFGTWIAKDRAAFDWYGGSSACRLSHHIYCVEQP